MSNAVRAYRLARAEVLRHYTAQEQVEMDPADLESMIDDQLAEWEIDAAQDRELRGAPEETPCIQSADLWGTGEGRYHGVIG